jgi:hypothetical protein
MTRLTSSSTSSISSTCPFYAAYRADGVGHAAFQPNVMVALLPYVAVKA